MHHWRTFLIVLFGLAWSFPMGRGAVEIHPSPNVAGPIKRSSSAIAITSDGATLLVVNPDSNSISLVDTASQATVVEIPVGVDPRTVTVDDAGHRAYVANRGSDRVSAVDLDAHATSAEVAVGNRPYGVVVSPSGDRLYVAEQGADQVRILDTTTLDTLSVLPTADRPSGLALSNDGRTLYVTHLLSSSITAITVRPHAIYLPLLRKDAATSPSPLAEARASRTPFLVSSLQLWPDSNLVQSIVLSPDGERAYVPHTRSNASNRALTFDTTVFPVVSAVRLSGLAHLVGQHIPLETIDPPGVGLPFDAAFSPDGSAIWVLNAASNDITVADLATRQRIAHIEVGDNPRGIVLSPDGDTAYVNNTLSGSVSVVDTTAYAVTAVITTTDIPLPPTLLRGKQLFHTSDDPRLSLAQWISCNTCHFEGEHDGRTWVFGFAGPRNTTSLLGMVETYPLRWSGEWNESADSEFANRKENFGSGLIAGEMNCSLSPPDCVNQPPNQGRSYDLDCLAAFIDSLQVPSSPSHVHGEPLTDAERRGQEIFHDPAVGCVSCHPPPLYTDQQMHDVGTTTPDERIGPAYDTPSLRGLYDSAPYFHDGSAATLHDALTFPSAESEHDVSALLTEAGIQDLIAFLLALPFDE
jgi:YVTN family beta-propeller protein